MTKWQNSSKAVRQIKVDTVKKNAALFTLIKNPDTTVFLDANVFIPADRSKLNTKAFDFSSWKKFWLDPLFECFSGLAVHESVQKELINSKERNYADEKEQFNRLKVFKNESLSPMERNCYNTYLRRLAVYSKYSPELDNSKDRGEVQTLSYMATKKYLYFAATH